MKFQRYGLPLVLLFIAVSIRLPGLNSFAATDEPDWLTQGSNFYYALGQREFQNTVYEYHPSVTTMWFVTAADLIYFPEYRGLGQGYFNMDKQTYDPFLIEHGKSPRHLLYLSRLFQIGMISLAALAIYYFLSKMFSRGEAFFLALLVSSSPYFLGHSRTLSHEAMVAVFTLASLLGLMVYLEYERKGYFLFASAAYAALAQLTKSSSIAMMPVVGLMFVLAVFARAKQTEFFPALMERLKTFFLWLLELALVYVVIWPGMWVAPGKMLYQVYGNAFSYAFQGARLDVTQELQPEHFQLASFGEEFTNFLINLAWRATPVIWVGFALAVIFLFASRRDDFSAVFRRLSLYLFAAALFFVILFSAAQGRNSPHYIMTSHVGLDLIAALGWLALWKWLQQRWQTAHRAWLSAGGAALLLLLHVSFAMPFYPYYYTYNNPLMSALMGRETLSDYGEGFDLAAAYLAQKPDAENIRALSFRGRGPFSYFFPGKAILLNPLFVEEPDMGSMVERLRDSDYLVVNDAFAERTKRSAFFMQALNQVAIPEYSLQAKGAYVIHIYDVKNIPPAFYEIISNLK